jgi:hypothetical protein
MSLLTSHEISSVFAVKFQDVDPTFGVYITLQFDVARELIKNGDFLEDELCDSAGRLIIPLSRKEAHKELLGILNEVPTETIEPIFVKVFDTFFTTALEE